MAAQALSGIAKDLTKMSAKSAIKVLVPEDATVALFKWVALLTGSKNALKGVGLLPRRRAARGRSASRLALGDGGGARVDAAGRRWLSLPRELGKAKAKAKFAQIFSKSREVNVLSAARFFLFGARDIWFVVGVPVFLSATLGWGFTEVGASSPLWVIGYGIVQSHRAGAASALDGGAAPQGRAAQVLAFLLAACHGGDRRRRSRAGAATRRWSSSRGLARVRRGVRAQLVGALVPDPRLLRRATRSR